MKLREFEGVAGKRDQYQIDPRLLKVRPNFNIRDLTTPAAREKLDILKAQIKAEGVLEALEIEFDGDTPWINEGHRRHLVVMELIADGHDFKSVPCIQERLNIKEDKRTLHMLMRSKEDYEPLEYAKGLDRMVNVYGWDKGALATALGFKSKGSIDGYLEMLGMTDEVKEQVAQGDVSATVALKVTRETRDAKTDPGFAAEIIAAAAAEQKALGKRGRATPKAITRAVERRNPKAAAPQPAPIMAANAEVEPEKPEVHAQLQTAIARESGQTVERVVETLHMLPPTRSHDISQKFFAIIARLATIGEESELNERGDDELIGVPAEVLKAADRAYREHIGDTTQADAA